jgi:potassium efflux system protein
MKAVPGVFRRLMMIILCLLLSPAWSADTDDVSTGPADKVVTASTLNARLKEVEASSTLDEQTRASLTELLNKALANLETASTNQAAIDSYIELRESSPAQVKKIREQLEKAKQAPSDISMPVASDSSFEEIEQALLQEKANLAAVDAKRGDLAKRLESMKARPGAIPKELAEAKQAREDLESKQKLPAPKDELAWVTEARRWAQATRIAALRSEINMLDQEALSLPFKVDLLEAQRDQQAQTVERMTARIKMLEELSSQQRHEEAKAAEVAAQTAVDEASGKDPLIQQLAEQNAELTREISALSVDLKNYSTRGESVDRDAKRIEENFRTAREQLAVAGTTVVLGEVLRRQRQTLPATGMLRKTLAQLEDEHARITLQLLQQDAEFKRLRNPEDSVAELVREMSRQQAGQIHDDLLDLTQNRRALLEQSINLHKSYLRTVTELTASYRNLLDLTTGYDKLLAENLLWIRSAPAPGLDTLAALPAQVGHLLSPSNWLEVPAAVLAGIDDSIIVKLLLLLVLILIWKSRQLYRSLVATGGPVGKPAVDSIACTIKALGLTLLLALPWPLLMETLGWALMSSPQVEPFPEQLSTALRTLAPTFFYIEFFSVLCRPGGVANKHFLWPGQLPKLLHRQFGFLKITLLPAVFILLMAIYDDKVISLAGVERFSMVAALLILALFFYRLSRLLVRQSISAKVRHRYFWLVLTVASPLLLAVAAFMGYFYTAGKLGGGLLQTLWIAFGLVILHQLVVRWLLLTQRRLALRTARERLTAGTREKQAGDVEMEGVQVQTEEPEIDLAALGEDTTKLLNMMLVIVGFFGVWVVWSDILPAFSVLDEVTLWHKPGIVAGEEALVPVTLGDLAIALLIAFLTFIAMKRLPPLLEILLLQRVNMTSGSRYTARTLYTYAIVGIGLIAFFNVVGMDWSKVQWLFAALSVGIGFGLQEIVANFISGLIILFERPIRIGDVVTIGETEGAVTRIQIRATTIRTWDGQELLVPNKEFITGRLLNWSLSDQITRIKIPVGIAYGSDVQKAMSLMDAAARQNKTILEDPAPYIIFNSFGDNALGLELRCYVGHQSHRIPAITNLHEAINNSFNEAGISISFPQRDVHLDVSAPLDVRVCRDGEQVPGVG